MVLLLFGLAVVQYTRQTADSPYVGSAFRSGFLLLAPMAAAIGLAWWADLRTRGR